VILYEMTGSRSARVDLHFKLRFLIFTRRGRLFPPRMDWGEVGTIEEAVRTTRVALLGHQGKLPLHRDGAKLGGLET